MDIGDGEHLLRCGHWTLRCALFAGALDPAKFSRQSSRRRPRLRIGSANYQSASRFSEESSLLQRSLHLWPDRYESSLSFGGPSASRQARSR